MWCGEFFIAGRDGTFGARRSAVKSASAILAVGLAGFATTASASDFSHHCRSADGAYRMDHGTLIRTKDGKEFKYQQGGKHVIRRKRGYCTDNRKKNTPYPFEYKSYVMSVTFTSNDKKVTKDMTCEIYTDGLPAGLNCDRETIMIDIKDPKF